MAGMAGGSIWIRALYTRCQPACQPVQIFARTWTDVAALLFCWGGRAGALMVDLPLVPRIKRSARARAGPTVQAGGAGVQAGMKEDG